MMLVGNKADLRDQSSSSQVTVTEGEQRAQEFGCSYIEASAKQRRNVDEIFINLIRQINKKNAVAAPAGKSKKKKGKCVLL